MPATPYGRTRREAYLRERGRFADLIREGYTQDNALRVIEGGRRQTTTSRTTLILISGLQERAYAQRLSRKPSEGEPAA
jgi:hypothetical protein